MPINLYRRHRRDCKAGYPVWSENWICMDLR